VSSSHNQFRELVPGYALGALDPEERAAFEAHLGTCAECTKALDAARLVVSELAHLAPPAKPSAQVEDRLLRQVRSEASAKLQTTAAPAAVPGWLWASLAAVLLFSVYSGWSARKLQNEISRLNEQAVSERKRREALEKEFVAAQVQALILMDPRSKKIMLPAKDQNMPQLEAMWHPEFGLCIMGQKVPMPGPNRTFQLWLIPKTPGKKPMPLHTMWPDASGKLMHVVENPPEPMGDTKAIAVTEEPAAGSPQPTSEPMWLGSVS
jgi:anti-sigma-K factor RskA